MALRDLLVLRENGATEDLYHTDRRDVLAGLLTHISAAQIFDLLRGTRELSRRFAANVSPALQLEAFFLRAWQ